MRCAIYPGSFDPVTNGHINLVHRGLAMFDSLIVAVARNSKKDALFELDERVELLRQCLADEPRVEVDTFEGLLVDYARRRGVGVLLRGLRAVSDFEYEFQMANINRKLSPDLDTIFMMTSEDHFYISSNMVREVARLGGSVKALVPPPVNARLNAMFGDKKG
ncbi:MAG: pantetheine-phosphate adenylyltransferase [Deltaproteobacteria bacterium]|nr:pantetheine-phosphate adenylyltransferase [Deltaproteobacteria bacterium]